jgi:hypothetical protein
MNKAIIELGDLRTEMESIKWDNMRKSVGAYSVHLSSEYTHLICTQSHSQLSLLSFSWPWNFVQRQRHSQYRDLSLMGSSLKLRA